MAKKPDTPDTEKEAPYKPEPWYEKFLERLRAVPNVRAACEAAGVGRSTAYDARQRDETFALEWADAVEQGLDALEQIAHARGTTGQKIRKTVTKTFADGKVEVTETEEMHISDTLLMFFLKRYRPEFRESFRIEHGGAGGGPIQHRVTVVDKVVGDFYDELDRLGSERSE